MRPVRGTRAFTLLELIVTLVVLGLLAAIAVPTFRTVQDNTKDETARVEVSAALRNAIALAAFNDGVVTLTEVQTAASEMVLESFAPGTLAASSTFTVVQSPTASARYGEISFSANGDVAVLAMVSKTGHCVLARSEGASTPESWVSKDETCVASGDLNVGDDPGDVFTGGPVELPLDPSKAPVEDLTADSLDTRVGLSWSPLPGATGYRVFRDGKLLLAVAAKAGADGRVSYIDTQVDNGKTYSYHVQAFDANVSWPVSKDVTATPMPPLPESPQAPGFTFGPYEGGGEDAVNYRTLTVSWKPVLRASSYEVYVDGLLKGKVGEDDNTLKIARVEVNRTYKLEIDAVNSFGRASRSPATEAREDQGVPTAPVVTSPRNWENGLELSWTRPAGTQKFEVYQDGLLVGTYSSGLTRVAVRGLKSETGYLFTVRAVNSAGEGPGGSVIATSGKPGTKIPDDLVSQPGPGGNAGDGGDGSGSGDGGTFTDGEGLPRTNDTYQLGARAGSHDVTLSWKAQTGAASYDVFRDGTLVGNTGSLTFTDIGLVTKTSYHYFVVAKTSSPSKPSGTITATTLSDTVVTIPVVPDGVTAVGGDAVAEVSWKSVPGATGYRVYVDGLVRATSSSTTAKVDKLKNGVMVNITVSAFNSAGESAQSTAVSVTPHSAQGPSGDTPAMPADFRASASGSVVTLTWSPVPGADFYQVFRDGALKGTSRTGEYSSTEEPGSSASWSVLAANTEGASAQTPRISVNIAPAAPVLTGSRTGTTAELSWTQQGAAESWIVRINGTDHKTYQATSATITGLVPGESYSFTVVAQSATGNSVPSNTFATTVALPPAAPSSLSARLENGVPVLSWTASPSSTGAPVSGYELYRKPAGTTGGGILVQSVSGTTYKDVDAPNVSDITYYVLASGAGGKSSASNEVTITTPPDTPTNIKATYSNGSIGVTWDAVPGANQYLVTRSGTEVYRGATNAYTDSTFNPNTTYYYQVTALRNGSAGTPSGSVSTTTPPAAPVLSATSGSGFVSLSWPRVTGATKNYRVYREPNPAVDKFAREQSGNTWTDNTVNNGTSYTYWVTASNVAGESVVSNKVTVTPNVGTAAAPASAATSVSEASGWKTSITWSKSATTGASAATGYYVWKGDEIIGTTTSAVTTFEDPNALEPGESVVYGVSSAGPGGTSIRQNATPNPTFRPGPGATPEDLTAESFGGGVDLSWAAVTTSTLRPVSGYEVFVDGEKRSTVTASATSIEGLVNGRTYSFQVRTIGGGGPSALSAPVTATPTDGWSRNFSYSADNDNQGLFTWFGSNTNASSTWVNPYTVGTVKAESVSPYTALNGADSKTPAGAINHNLDLQQATALKTRGYVTYDLGAGLRFKPSNVYFVANTNYSLTASNDLTNWVQVLNGGSGTKSGVGVTTPGAYRYFRITNTASGSGNLYITEYELYGSLRATAAATTPAAVTGVTATSGTGKVTAKWTATPISGNLPVYGYRVYVNGVPREVVGSLSNTLEVATTGSTRIAVSAYGPLGEGPRSAEVTATG